MRKLLVLGAIVATVAVPMSLPASAVTQHCPAGYDYKVEGNSGAVVLPAGTQFCVKAGTGASGLVYSDGIHSLSYYVTWLTNGGQTPGVSYYAVYDEYCGYC